MHLYQEQFSKRFDYDKVTKPTMFLIIASTPRCGSHMLGHALQRTNYFGFPLEYANPVNIAEWKKRFNKERLSDVLKKIMELRTSPNGVFGIKVHYSHIQQFGGFVYLKNFFPDAFYVLLTRRDVLKQAVSMSIAKQTGVWISGQESSCKNHQYIYKDINNCLRDIILDTASWRYLLAANGCNYTEMEFEDIQKDLISSIKKIATFMQIDIDTETIPKEPVTKKQSNRKNICYEKKYLFDYNGDELINVNIRPHLRERFTDKRKLINRIKKKIKRVLEK